MKIDQIAFYARHEDIDTQIKTALGLAEATWLSDIVTFKSKTWDASSGRLTGEDRYGVGLLQFNYDLGTEVEILRYLQGDHFHQLVNERRYTQLEAFISHVGAHLSDGEEWPEMLTWPLIQETETISHTASVLTRPDSAAYGRRFVYRIHQIAPGQYFKLIRRVHPPKA